MTDKDMYQKEVVYDAACNGKYWRRKCRSQNNRQGGYKKVPVFRI